MCSSSIKKVDMQWLKSVRSISVIILILGLTAGLFTSHIPSENFIQVAMIVVGAYFVKKDKE